VLTRGYRDEATAAHLIADLSRIVWRRVAPDSGKSDQ